MKQYFYFFAITLTFFFASCTKKDELAPTKTYTDTPPAALFTNNSAYGSIQRLWIDNEVMQKETTKSGCEYWYDQYGNISFNSCGEWGRIATYVYWGRLNGVDYFSKGKIYVWISPDASLQATRLLRNLDAAIGEYNDWSNVDLGSRGVVTWVRQQ